MKDLDLSHHPIPQKLDGSLPLLVRASPSTEGMIKLGCVSGMLMLQYSSQHLHYLMIEANWKHLSKKEYWLVIGEASADPKISCLTLLGQMYEHVQQDKIISREEFVDGFDGISGVFVSPQKEEMIKLKLAFVTAENRCLVASKPKM